MSSLYGVIIIIEITIRVDMVLKTSHKNKLKSTQRNTSSELNQGKIKVSDVASFVKNNYEIQRRKRTVFKLSDNKCSNGGLFSHS